MVRGLTVGINQYREENNPDILASSVPKSGEHHKFIIDGLSLAYYVLSEKEHSTDFINGGSYADYNTRIAEFFKLFKELEAQFVIVLPLSEGCPPVSDIAIQRWNAKAQEKLRRVERVKTTLEKSNFSSRFLLEVLPPMMTSTIVKAAAKAKCEVVYTRNNVTRFAADYVAKGKADAVIGLNSDFLVFSGVNYIPIDSIEKDINGDLKLLLLNNEICCQMLGLENPERLFDLAVLLGNIFTESFVNSKYNMAQYLNIKHANRYPTALVHGVVEFLNKPEFDTLENTEPISNIIAIDEAFKKAIEDSRSYFDLSVELTPEGESEIRKLTEEGKLPLWAPGVEEGGDFWYDPVLDDYSHDVKTANVTSVIRQIIYTILGRKTVVEHIPNGQTIETVEVNGTEGIPSFEQLKSLSADNKINAFYKIAHSNFPKPPSARKDPLFKLDEPLRTVGFALRILVAQCFTDNQTPFTHIQPKGNEALVEAGVKGAPPVDYFELVALATQAIIINMTKRSNFIGGSAKPRLRRIKVTALYQNVIQHLLWLQQFFGVESQHSAPHRFFDGPIFAAAYDCHGECDGEDFLAHFEDPEEIIKLFEKKVKVFLDNILFPFPEGLFEAFVHVPRSIATAAFDEAKPVATNIKAGTSIFQNLEEEDVPEDAIPEPPVIEITPPAPAPKKQQKQKTPEEEEQEMLEFLKQQAARNAELAAQRKVSVAKPKKKKPVSARKKVDPTTISKQVFDKESKNEFKRQLKQQTFSWE